MDTTVEAEVSQVVKQVVELNNLKHKIERLRLEGGELAKYGPALCPEDQEDSDGEVERIPTQSEEGLLIDPTGRRSGEGWGAFPFACLFKNIQAISISCMSNSWSRACT